MLVYSITDDTTFAKLDKVREEVLRSQGRAVPIFLVGTKADLASDRAVSEKERLAKAKAWGGCPSFEISSKAEGAGVNDLFCKMVQSVLVATGDQGLGGGGGSVMGAGRLPVTDTQLYKKKKCAFM